MAATRTALSMFLGLLVGATGGHAQLSAGYSVASFPFNLSNPGARSLALGGAFTGLADDATAAYANPAGLTILTRPEISFEGRSANFALPLISAEPNRVGINFQELAGQTVVLEELVDVGVTRAETLGAPDASGTNASFVSWVFPVRRWTFAVYRHQLVDLEASGSRQLETLVEELRVVNSAGEPITRTGVTTAFTEAAADVDVSSFGAAAAFRASERLSLGLTLVRNRAAIATRRSGTSVDERLQLFGQTTENLVASEDTDLTVNAGLLLRVGERWAVGLVVREGPVFDLADTESTSFSGVIAGLDPRRREFASESFAVPDVIGAGASYRPTQSLLVSFEWDRVRYSSLRAPARLPRTLSFFGSEFIADLDDVTASDLGSFEVEDADELRLGLEYAFWDAPTAPAIRLGVWFDPDHQIRFQPTVSCPTSADAGAPRFECRVRRANETGEIDAALEEETYQDVTLATIAASLARLFPPGDDELHLTGGVGVVLGARYQLDAAFDYVDSDRFTLSLSGVVRF